MAVVIETTLGDVTVDLFIQERPRACLNFLKLCKLKYYNYNLFHTVERGFIGQTGDPTGVGDGGESVWGVIEGAHKRFFEGESLPKIKHTVPGLLTLVSVGKNMLGSQFFFTLGSDLTSLDGIHCVIGEVVEGHEVLRKLNEAIVDEKFRPYQDIRVTHTVVLEDPFDDPRGFQIPSRSPSPSADRLKNGRIGADEDIDDTDGKTAEEIQEMLAEREAKARATILEIVGDLPDAECAPPENVLFVCKLNPVTTDDDLEIIFSRFGKVKGCEVIRDKVTGDSLQYAFVEFEEQKSCENAFFKMDNVLIDDRRIHVDFSQSVAKIKWRGKGRGIEHEDGKHGRLDFNNLKGNKHDRRSRSRSNGRQAKRRSRSPQHQRRRRRSEDRNRESFKRDRSSDNYNQNKYDRVDRYNNRERFESSRCNQNERQLKDYRSRSPVGQGGRISRHKQDERRRTDTRNRSPVNHRGTNAERSNRRTSPSPKKIRHRSQSPLRKRTESGAGNDSRKKNKKKHLKKKSKKSKKKGTSSSDDSSSSSEEERRTKKKKKSKKNTKNLSSSDSSSD